MPKQNVRPAPASGPIRVRRGYFECRYGQLHVHNAMPPGGGFEEGTPLLCLHDLPGSGRSFVPFLSLAGRERSAYAPDLPGFGESDPPPAVASLADYVAAVGDFLDTMRLRRVDLVGVRSGALLAAELALTRGVQVGRLVWVSAPLGGAPAPADSPPWQRAINEGLARYPARERLSQLTQRLLVLRPRDDQWEATGRVREFVPSARVIEVELPGRELLAAAPERMLDAVRDFLRG